MNKKKSEAPTTYQVGNTTYTVKPIYGEAAQTERIEDKIRRLILLDKKHEKPTT